MNAATPTEELVITRTFDAPRELVYQAFVDPDQISQWFGPVGWSVPRDTVDIDPRPGGKYNFTMVNDEDPEQASPSKATFKELVPNELIVGSEKWDMPGYEDLEMFMRLEFEDVDGKTKITLRQGPYTAEMVEMAREGWESSFTKLDKVLVG
ncbi:MAG TPA: SRPBCC domain-containing protein [Acidimicrobiales bacterium]|nr:SRPBCC domain-containing protein [Acidimicrobiales bacterium]